MKHNPFQRLYFPILFIILTVLFTSVVFAGEAHNVTLQPANNISLVNASWTNATTIYLNYNVTGNESIYDCNLWNNWDGTNGSFVASASFASASVANNTIAWFAVTGIPANNTKEGGLEWNVRCENDNGVGVWAPTNQTLRVDRTVPTINSVFPALSSWRNQNNFRFFVNVSDTNAANCSLSTNLNASLSNSSMAVWNMTAETNDSITSNLNTTFLFGNATGARPATWNDNNTGSYQWSITCQDNATNIVKSENVTFFVDTTAPTAFVCQSPTNSSADTAGIFLRSTDFTPDFDWNNTIENNFSRYELYVNDTVSNGIRFQFNVTNSTYSNHTFSLTNKTDNTYNWWITAYDLGGLSTNAANCTQTYPQVYRTDETCSVLVTGWNICGVVRNGPLTASQIANETAATFIAMFNSSKEFQLYENGTSTNDDMQFGQGDNVNSTVIIYVPSNRTWENNTWGTNQTNTFSFPLTNVTTEGWNLVPQSFLYGRTVKFGWLDRSLNGNHSDDVDPAVSKANVSEMVVYEATNQSSPFHKGHSANFTVAGDNETTFDYGQSVWMFYQNGTVGRFWDGVIDDS